MASWKKLLHESSSTGDFPTLNQNTSGTAAGLSTALAVASGGTNTTSYTAGDILYASGSTTLSKLGVGTAGQVLQMNSGATAPEWAAASSGDITSVVAGTGMTGGATSGAATVNVIGGDGITANADDMAITAAQTTITSIYNSGLKIGYGASDAVIDFSTDNNINFLIDGSSAIKFKAAGEIEAGSLDISGDVDVDGTLETDALTIGGVAGTNYFSVKAGNTSLTTVGTIGTGTWQGSSIGVAYTDAKCTDANADQTSANDCAHPHVATNISWTAGTTAGPTCNSSTGTDAAIPAAGHAASGIVTTGTQSFAGEKTFTANVIFDGNISVSGTSTITNTTTENVSIADSMLKLRAGTSSWRDQGFVFDRGAQNAGSEGFVSTNGLDAALWYDAGTGHLTVGEVAVDLNEDDTSADDITAISGTANVHQIALCMASSATPSGVKMPVGSIAVDTDGPTAYIRLS